ncbi:hypothetical protein PYCC9005_004732 [Savitreella phatthalungensis]
MAEKSVYPEVSDLEAKVAEAAHNLRAVPETTRLERWAYYLYANGGSGVGAGTYVPLQYSTLAKQAGHTLLGDKCTDTDKCFVRFGAIKQMDVSASIQLMSGISFTLQMFLFVTIGPLADFGLWARGLALSAAILSWAGHFAFAGLRQPSQYGWAAVMNLAVGLGYTTAGMFFQAAFPSLAANEPEVREMREAFVRGDVTAVELEEIDARRRNYIMVVATTWSNIGYVGTLAICLAPLLAIEGDYANNAAIIVAGAYYLLSSMWWYVFWKPRPGPALHKSEHPLTIGWIMQWRTFRSFLRLSQTFVCLIAYFIFVDGMNTIGTLIGIEQNNIIEFSFLQSTYVNLLQAICSVIGCVGFLAIQRRFDIRIKTMFQWTNSFILFTAVWGCIGCFNHSVGYHSKWEIWAYNAFFGLLCSPWYAYIYATFSEVTPKGHENQFFSLFAYLAGHPLSSAHTSQAPSPPRRTTHIGVSSSASDSACWART